MKRSNNNDYRARAVTALAGFVRYTPFPSVTHNHKIKASCLFVHLIKEKTKNNFNFTVFRRRTFYGKSFYQQAD
jgi:hypothetical protein